MCSSGMCERAASAISPIPMCTGPTASPISVAPIANTAAQSTGTTARGAEGARVALPSAGRVAGTAVTSLP